MSLQLCVFNSNFVRFSFTACFLFVLIQKSTAKPTPEHRCECTIKTVNYLKEFNFLTSNDTSAHLSSVLIKTMQNFTGVLKETGELDEETCTFMNRRWPNKIVHWRHSQTPYFMGTVSKLLNADVVRTVFNEASEHWSNITNLVIVEADSKYAEIQISFVNHTIQKSNNRTTGPKGEKSLYDNSNLIGRAHLPGYDKGGQVEFYGWRWYSNQSVDTNNNSHNLLAAAIHAFGYALGLYESTYENSIDADLLEYIPDEDQVRMINQKFYKSNKTRSHVEN